MQTKSGKIKYLSISLLIGVVIAGDIGKISIQ
jgi:hypothetical protein